MKTPVTLGEDYSPHGRTERLIASGRVVLAASSLLAIWLDPLQPATYERQTYALLAAYLGYSGAVALLVWRSALVVARRRLLMHVIDLAAFAVFVVLTDGPPTSPFFVYFVFSILCATLRWGWRATLWTAIASLALVAVAASVTGQLFDDERLNRFIIRSGYLSVIAVMLGYLGAYEQQLRSEIARLAAWPRGERGERRELLRATLGHAAEVMAVPRVLLVWDEPEEPWLNVVAWTADGFAWERQAPGQLEPLVDAEVGRQPFLCADAGAPAPRVVAAVGPHRYRRWDGMPVHARLREQYRIRAVLSARVAGEAFDGRIFFLDRPQMDVDHLMLGTIVAEQVAAHLEHVHLQQRLTQSTIMEERVRFARDLHDGLLQSLTGTALQLQAIRRVVTGDPADAVARLEEVQHLIVAEQRNLRSYIHELRPASMLAGRAQANLRTALRALPARVERQWGLRVQLEVADELPECQAAGLAHHITHIVHEALVNAARHGGASAASVRVEERGDQVLIAVEDNGRGFPFRGRYDLPALNEMDAGPLTLRERVAALRGALVIDSHPTGARLEIALPLGVAA
jgi:signal transduction histidine kinase